MSKYNNKKVKKEIYSILARCRYILGRQNSKINYQINLTINYYIPPLDSSFFYFNPFFYLLHVSSQKANLFNNSTQQNLNIFSIFN